MRLGLVTVSLFQTDLLSGAAAMLLLRSRVPLTPSWGREIPRAWVYYVETVARSLLGGACTPSQPLPRAASGVPPAHVHMLPDPQLHLSGKCLPPLISGLHPYGACSSQGGYCQSP